MDRSTISAIAHGDHPIAAPLNDDSVSVLLDRALLHGDERVLDLGCGQATWLSRALTGRPGVSAVGVDIEPTAIERARASLDRLGFTDRVELHAMDAANFTDTASFDLVLSVGAAHAFGGLLPTLNAARRFLAPGGTLLVGDGFWEQEPSAAVIDAGFAADEFQSLPETIDEVTNAAWLPTYAHVSSAHEWDQYEWSWIGTLSRWALDHPEHEDSTQALAAAAEHQSGWLNGYRGFLGFVTLVLRDVRSP